MIAPDDSDPAGPPAPVRAEVAAAIRQARMAGPRNWHTIEELVRQFVRSLRATGTRPERSVAEVKLLIAEATGDPAHTMLHSAISWTLSEYYDRDRER